MEAIIFLKVLSKMCDEHDCNDCPANGILDNCWSHVDFGDESLGDLLRLEEAVSKYALKRLENENH